MEWLSQKVGWLLDMLTGPRTTSVYDGGVKHKTERLRPHFVPNEVEIGVISKRIIYRTRYKRWWVPDSFRCVFEVTAYAPAEFRDKVDPRLFETHYYPSLCNRWVAESQYGHLYAIHAFLDRLTPIKPTTEVPL